MPTYDSRQEFTDGSSSEGELVGPNSTSRQFHAGRTYNDSLRQMAPDPDGGLLRRSESSAGDDGASSVGGGTGDGDGRGGGGNENAVSMLQEYIQSCSTFSPHTKILTWSFEQHLDENTSSLQFRATVSFVFADVPHLFCGGWQTAKKKAQRDTAERVRRYLTKRFEQQPSEGEARTGEVRSGESSSSPKGRIGPAHAEVTSAAPREDGHAIISPGSLPDAVAQELKMICEGFDPSSLSSGFCNTEWKMEDRRAQAAGEGISAGFRATLSFKINNVLHHFGGSWCSEALGARQDTAERVLWYFGRSSQGFECPDGSSLGGAICAPAPALPPSRGVSQVSPTTLGSPLLSSPPGKSDPAKAVEDKTILMQVQNSLQKSFAKDIPPGQRVWVWDYEADDHDPQLFRAHVEVPSWGKTFVGDWCRGKKLAQRNACLLMKQHLDQNPPAET